MQPAAAGSAPPRVDPNTDDLVRFPPAVAKYVAEAKWKTSLSSRWKHEDHITMLEARAVNSQLRWLATNSLRQSQRYPFFIDSQAALGAFAKGRSSSKRLNRVLRRGAAYQLAGDLRMSWMWVPTDYNPSDLPSRVFPS